MPGEMWHQHGPAWEQEKAPQTGPEVTMMPAGADTHHSVLGWAENRLKTPRAGGTSGQGWPGRC